MHRILQENLSWRGARHPWLDWHPSAGSIFKKIEGVGAGRLVDQCGLKGYRVGDAQISHIHANIMVNLGHATAADVIALIRHAQTTVRETARARARARDRLHRRVLSRASQAGFRSSGGTKFERNCRSCGVRLAIPDALILSRMRSTSSRLTAWMLFRSTFCQSPNARVGDLRRRRLP